MTETTMKRCVLGTCIAAASMAACVAKAGVPSLEEAPRLIPGMYLPGFGGFAVADFDGDGREDIAVPASNGAALFQIIGSTAEGITRKQAEILPGPGVVRLVSHRIGGAWHLFAMGNVDHVLRDYSGWPLTLVRSIPLALDGFPALAIGDVDADGTDEVIAVDGDTGDYVRAYDLDSGLLKWSIPHDGARNVRLAQLDADAALEIVLDGATIRVIDGATHADDWSHDDGHYTWGIETGHFLDAGTQIAAEREGGAVLSVFKTSPYSAAWDVQNAWSIDEFAAGDLDGDGFDEIASGESQWGSIKVHDGRTHEIRLSLPHAG